MVSSDLRIDIDSRLGEIFMMILEKTFAELSLMTLGNSNYLQSDVNLNFHNFFIRIVRNIY